MATPEKFGHLHLVYHFTVPLSLFDEDKPFKKIHYFHYFMNEKYRISIK